MDELVKMANIAKVKANLAAGMPMMDAIKKAYPDYTPDQVKALAAQMGGMGKTASKGKAAREALEEAMVKFLSRGGRVKKLPKGNAQGSDSMTFQQVGRPMETIRTAGGRTMTVPHAGVKIASYSKALKTGKANKHMNKKKLAHALMLKIANTTFVPPASMITMPARKPKTSKAPAGPGIKLVGRTQGKTMRGADGNPMGPVGKSLKVGGGQPIYAQVKPKVRTQPKMPVPPNNLKAQYVKK